MEMVKTKLTLFVLLLFLASCQRTVSWESIPVDAHMTGVSAVLGFDYTSSLGYVDSVYHAPNGMVFDCGCTPVVAQELIDVQPEVAYLKEIIGFSPVAMERGRGDVPLANWVADNLLIAVQSLTGRKVDMALTNYGGIRINMPEGDVLTEDIVSMLPFNNKLCFVRLKGSDIRVALDHMADYKVDAVSGVRFVIKDGKAQDIEFADGPMDDDKVYSVATIDFLLDGGDGYYLGRNAEELILHNIYVREWFVPFVRTLTAGGDVIESASDGRIRIL